jgi:Alkylmercury lyase
MDFDTQVKICVYRHFADTGEAPTTVDVAGRLGCSTGDAVESYGRLRAQRVLLLEPDGSTIRMAPPFSGVPTVHRVEAAGRWYYANCAWDAFGIPAALQRDAVVHSQCGQSAEPLRLEVSPKDGPEPSDWLFHCLVPAARWWVDLVFT